MENPKENNTFSFCGEKVKNTSAKNNSIIYNYCKERDTSLRYIKQIYIYK